LSITSHLPRPAAFTGEARLLSGLGLLRCGGVLLGHVESRCLFVVTGQWVINNNT
jgi:hypothetical protein